MLRATWRGLETWHCWMPRPYWRASPRPYPTELARGRGGGGPASKRVVVAYGFWIFILSDMIMFSALFAAYAVLRDNTAGGPTGAELFDLRNVFIETMVLLVSSYTCGLGALSAERRQPGRFLAFAVLRGNTAGGPTGAELFNLRNVFIETMCLLFSSYTCGLGALSAERRQPGRLLIFAVFTFVLGAAFLFIEVSEFARMVENGAGPSRSAFLSAFFTLVGTHGIHVASGLIALIYLVAQVIAKGLRAPVLRRLLCWSLFWHALDIVWVGVFTLVYLMGD